MEAQTFNLCTRCGKPRIISKTWKEKVQTYNGLTEITCTQSVCPDKNCQKIVDRDLAERRAKAEEVAQNKELRVQASKQRRVGIKIASDKKKAKDLKKSQSKK